MSTRQFYVRPATLTDVPALNQLDMTICSKQSLVIDFDLLPTALSRRQTAIRLSLGPEYLRQYDEWDWGDLAEFRQHLADGWVWVAEAAAAQRTRGTEGTRATQEENGSSKVGGDVDGDVSGDVDGDVSGDVGGDVGGDVSGDVGGDVSGDRGVGEDVSVGGCSGAGRRGEHDAPDRCGGSGPLLGIIEAAEPRGRVWGHETDDSMLELVSLFVDRSSRGQGVGRTLVQTLIAAAKQRHRELLITQAESGNLAAVRFYQSLGFVLQGVGFLRPDEVAQRETPLLLVRRLSSNEV